MNEGVVLDENANVLRVVRKGAKYLGRPPRYEITAANFVRRRFTTDPQGQEPGISLGNAAEISATELLRVFTNDGDTTQLKVATAAAIDVRSLGFELFRTPTFRIPSHISLRCKSCNRQMRDCLLADSEECELEDLERRSRLADVFSLLPEYR